MRVQDPNLFLGLLEALSCRLWSCYGWPNQTCSALQGFPPLWIHSTAEHKELVKTLWDDCAKFLPELPSLSSSPVKVSTTAVHHLESGGALPSMLVFRACSGSGCLTPRACPGRSCSSGPAAGEQPQIRPFLCAGARCSR